MGVISDFIRWPIALYAEEMARARAMSPEDTLLQRLAIADRLDGRERRRS
jgi:hypothetical protein